jgi:hypothetical protein
MISKTDSTLCLYSTEHIRVKVYLKESGLKFDYAWDAAWSARLLHVDEKANGIEKLRRLIANFVNYKAPVAGGCAILNTAIDADDGNPVLRTRVGKALRSWLGHLQAILEEAHRRGETRPKWPKQPEAQRTYRFLVKMTEQARPSTRFPVPESSVNFASMW